MGKTRQTGQTTFGSLSADQLGFESGWVAEVVNPQKVIEGDVFRLPALWTVTRRAAGGDARCPVGCTRLEAALSPQCCRDSKVVGTVAHCAIIIFWFSSTHPWNFATAAKDFVEDTNYINGLTDFCVDLLEDVTEMASLPGINVHGHDSHFQVDFEEFPPGSVVAFRYVGGISWKHRADIVCLVFRINLNPKAQEAVKKLQSNLSSRSANVLAESPISKLSLADLNHVLFRCEEEEIGGGAYEVPKTGKLVYCGLQGNWLILNFYVIFCRLGIFRSIF